MQILVKPGLLTYRQFASPFDKLLIIIPLPYPIQYIYLEDENTFPFHISQEKHY